MKILFVGGTGNLSLDCSYEALAKGMDVFHLNRGSNPGFTPPEVATLRADIRDEKAAATALEGREFDAVVDFISYVPAQVESAMRLFEGRTAQYVFISSASAYRKPPVHHVITEATPLSNPYWGYSRDKIACERLLEASFRERGFPVTIVRPSHTYGNGWVPLPFSSSDFTVPQRMLDGKEVIVHGDGQSLWTLTHARDFARGLVGLLGNPAAIGEAFQVTSDEALTWDAIHRAVGAALGVEPKIVHMPSEFIASVDPELGSHLLGDKTWSSIFDCSKLKRLVPDFRTVIPFSQGIRASIRWLEENPGHRVVKPGLDATIERLLAAWKGKTGA
ncbi:MAG: SDR family oxidoreductase [Spirochaetes bacterium]|nr:SDR family oxidoreductase [Spirochaetota bacterium]